MGQTQGMYGEWDLSIVTAFLITAFAITILTTRIITGNGTIQSEGAGKGSRPPMLPYWVPFIGHLPKFLHDPETLLQQARETFPTGIFALKLGRYRHNVVYSPTLIQNALSQNKGSESADDLNLDVKMNVFGVDMRDRDLYRKLLPELNGAVAPHLQFKADMVRHLQANLIDLVTLNSSMVDQEPWERLSLTDVSSDNESAVASLLPLVHIFLTHITVDSVFTPSIFSDSDHLEIAPLLLALVQSYGLLMTGISRLFPHPSLPTAHLTRKKLLSHLNALSADVLEDPEMIGSMLSARQAVLDKHDAPLDLRASDLLALLWNINTPHILAFWLLLHLVSDETLLSHVRKETSNYTKVVQEAPVMGFTVPPQITIDIDGLREECPLFKSAYIETVRLYSRGLHACKVTEDLSIETEGAKVFKKGEKWAVKTDEFVDVPFWLSNTDPATFQNPGEWDADRHLETDEKGEDSAKWGSVIPDCGIFGLEQGRDMAEKSCLAFVAGTISIWDFEPVDRKGWKIPQADFAAGVALPKGDIRTRIRRREPSTKEL